MKNKTKIFPKVKRKIKGFLTDESGKITKKDALGLSVGALLLAGTPEVFAGHNSSYSGYTPNGHTSGAGGTCAQTVAYSEHASGIVNGHYSGDVNGSVSGTTCNAGTAGHGNVTHTSGHGSHGSCGRGHW